VVVTFASGFPTVAASSGNAAISSYTELLRAVESQSIRSATLEDDAHLAIVVYRNGRTTTVRYPASDTTLAQRMVRDGVDVRISTSTSGISPILPPLLFVTALLVISVLVASIALARRRDRSRAPARAQDRFGGGMESAVAPSAIPETRFADVAGCDEAVEELAEIVAFLQTPEKFSRLDAHMPAGLLLTGPPGTGKTMLARALAGEAGVRFFAASASEFVEKYVGVGASRVRDLFKRAAANAPAVIFLDELDAIGVSRGNIDGNSERDQTLNELLVRMDGFSGSDHVVVVAATNRPEILDPALLRPGRFSRQITIGLPSAEGRRAILGVHSNSKPLAPEVDLDTVAATTGGFSGAQLAELLNEAAILAARDDRELIEADDIREGLRRVVAGPKRKSAPIAEGELEKIAYHEAGHVVCAELCEHHENAQHVTIDPRGNAMGFALFGQEDRALWDDEHIRDAMVAALGGRAAEELVYGRVSSGAKNDLEKVNGIARAAVTEYGMSSGLPQFVGDERRLSNQTKARIDREVERLVATAYAGALALLGAHRRELDKLANRLLEARELERLDIVSVLG
jgi:cell division protease FtsH